jgi:hypothetical protein
MTHITKWWIRSLGNDGQWRLSKIDEIVFMMVLIGPGHLPLLSVEGVRSSPFYKGKAARGYKRLTD